MNEIIYLLFLLYLFLPTFVSNAVPVVIKNVPFIKIFNRPINSKLFWKNKTYRWFISWIFFAILISLIQFILSKYIFIESVSNNFYEIISNYNIAIISWFLQWFWALLWDIIQSFIKRKIGKKPWEAWPFFDWIDYIIWWLILFSFIYIPSFWWITFLILISPLLSLVSNIFSYLMWWKNVWW